MGKRHDHRATERTPSLHVSRFTFHVPHRATHTAAPSRRSSACLLHNVATVRFDFVKYSLPLAGYPPASRPQFCPEPLTRSASLPLPLKAPIEKRALRWIEAPDTKSASRLFRTFSSSLAETGSVLSVPLGIDGASTSCRRMGRKRCGTEHK